MSKPLNLSVISPDRVILQTESVSMIRIRLHDDSLLSIYPGHAPLLAESLYGKLEYVSEGHHYELTVPAGILHITQQSVTVFVTGTDHVCGAADDSDASAIMQFEKLYMMLKQSLNANASPDSSS